MPWAEAKQYRKSGSFLVPGKHRACREYAFLVSEAPWLALAVARLGKYRPSKWLSREISIAPTPPSPKTRRLLLLQISGRTTARHLADAGVPEVPDPVFLPLRFHSRLDSLGLYFFLPGLWHHYCQWHDCCVPGAQHCAQGATPLRWASLDSMAPSYEHRRAREEG